MKDERNGDTIVAESFLDTRAKLLEIAATYDRIDRAGSAGALGKDAEQRRRLLKQATEILLSDTADRAERLQQLFSRDYDSSWRDQFGLVTPR